MNLESSDWRERIENEEMLSPTQFARLLNVSLAAVRRWLLLRRIDSIRVNGRLVRIPKSEAARLMSFIPARETKQ
jgi:excisionase family DNA binding protein